MLLTAGQRADCTQFEPVMECIRVPRLGPGRPRTTPDSVSADKAYTNRRTRCYLRRRGIRHVIPEKSDQAVNRVRRGRGGGRPPGFDKEREGGRFAGASARLLSASRRIGLTSSVFRGPTSTRSARACRSGGGADTPGSEPRCRSLPPSHVSRTGQRCHRSNADAR